MHISSLPTVYIFRLALGRYQDSCFVTKKKKKFVKETNEYIFLHGVLGCQIRIFYKMSEVANVV